MEADSTPKPERASSSTPIAFQFDDVQALARRILQRATEQAQRKLAAANAQASDIEKMAYEDGHKKGHADGCAKGEAEGRVAGEKAAREEFQNRVQGVVKTLEVLLGELKAREVELRSQAEADLLQLSLAIARRIVRREITIDPSYIVPTVREAIGLATDRSDLAIHAHPQDIAAIETELPQLRAAFADLGKVFLEADPALARGEIRVLGVEGEIDMRLEQQFGTIERALLGLGAETPKPEAGPSRTTAPTEDA